MWDLPIRIRVVERKKTYFVWVQIIQLIFRHGIFSSFINGVKVGSKTVTTDPRITAFPGGGKLVLGQLQSVDTLGFDIVSSFSGKISWFNIWNSVISDPEIEFYSECTSKLWKFNKINVFNILLRNTLISGSLIGSVIDWGSASWNITSSVVVEAEDLDSLCQTYPNKTYVVFPELREVDSANSICASFGRTLFDILKMNFQSITFSTIFQITGGKVFVPISQNENDAVKALAENYASLCQRNLLDGRTFWLGIQSSSVLGVWMVGHFCEKIWIHFKLSITFAGFFSFEAIKLHKLGPKC